MTPCVKSLQQKILSDTSLSVQYFVYDVSNKYLLEYLFKFIWYKFKFLWIKMENDLNFKPKKNKIAKCPYIHRIDYITGITNTVIIMERYLPYISGAWRT